MPSGALEFCLVCKPTSKYSVPTGTFTLCFDFFRCCYRRSFRHLPRTSSQRRNGVRIAGGGANGLRSHDNNCNSQKNPRSKFPHPIVRAPPNLQGCRPYRLTTDQLGSRLRSRTQSHTPLLLRAFAPSASSKLLPISPILRSFFWWPRLTGLGIGGSERSRDRKLRLPLHTTRADAS